MVIMNITRRCNLRCVHCYAGSNGSPAENELTTSELLHVIDDLAEFKCPVVLFSGGEPLLQQGIDDFLKEIKKLEYLIKLDTNGSFPQRLNDVIKKKLIDYLAMDIKAPLEKYAEVVNSTVEVVEIKESINLIMNSGLDYEFRTTIVKSQLKEEDILKIGEWLKPSSLYILQKFVPSKTLDPRFLKESSYSNEELERTKRKLKELYNLICVIR